jgi:hypothetical protein
MAEISLTGATKIAGYAKKTVYNGNIEYRNFSPDLVGLQLTSEGGTPLFTMGNFNITTNLDPKTDKTFITKQFSDFVTLEGLNLSVPQTETLLNNNAVVFLNVDKTKLSYYATFGSLTEYIRVALENIIINWPASIYTNPIKTLETGYEITGYTYENYVYSELTNTSTFKIPTNFIANPYSVNYLINGDISNTFNETNTLRNMVTDYASYALLFNSIEYDVIGFTGSTSSVDSYIHFEIKDNPFTAASSTISFHIKPKNIICDNFFNGLDEFEYYLLNRQSFPIYTATFKYPLRTDFGVLLYTEKSVTWPVSDGYNLDYQSIAYENYATVLFNLASDSDLINSNIMTRFLVSESITGFDTMPYYLSDEDQDTSGGKVNKLLNIYGTSYDSFNRYIEGIQFANTVSYNKLDNTPDVYLKNLARVMGWELIESVISNDLLTDYVKSSQSTFSGQSVGLTPVEADVELWRRIILNTPWIWKSKGTRKTIEFLLRFIGTPNGLITFNEYVYKADKPIDMELFLTILELNGLDTDISNYPVDSEGYPRFFNDTDDMYFQGNGLWYRETSGPNSILDLTAGNNPHIGPYDRGYKYFNQLRTLIPNFTPVVISSSTVTTTTQDLFTNYNTGEITDYDGPTYVNVQNLDGSNLSDCIVHTTEIIKDPKPEDIITECGCPCESIKDESLSVCLETKKQIITEDECFSRYGQDTNSGLFVFVQYYEDNQGNNTTQTYETNFIDRTCCTTPPIGGYPMYNDIYDSNTNTISSGYVCCMKGYDCACNVAKDWVISQTPVIISGESYLNFITLNGFGNNVVVGAGSDTTFCPNVYAVGYGDLWTTPISDVTDPYTGLVGFGCRLTPYGLANLQVLYNAYQQKIKDGAGCEFVFPNVESEPVTCLPPILTNVDELDTYGYRFAWVLNQTPCGNGIVHLQYSFDNITYSDFEFSTYTQEPLVTDLRGYTSDNQYNNFNTLVYFRLRLEYGISSDCNTPITNCDVYSNVLTIDYTPSKVLVNIRRGNYSTSDIELGVATGLPTNPQLEIVCKETKFYINCLITPQIFNEFTAGDLIKNADGSVFIGNDKWIALDYNIPNVNPKVCKVDNNGVIIAATSVGCQ